MLERNQFYKANQRRGRSYLAREFQQEGALANHDRHAQENVAIQTRGLMSVLNLSTFLTRPM